MLIKRAIVNASPLIVLFKSQQVELLPHLFGQVAIPQAVFVELKAEKAPAQLQEWMRRVPQ